MLAKYLVEGINLQIYASSGLSSNRSFLTNLLLKAEKPYLISIIEIKSC
jgi:hypothetical protein